MQSIGSICNMRGADIFASRQEIDAVSGNQGAKRYLKRLGFLRRSGSLFAVNVNRVITDADCIIKQTRPGSRIIVCADVLFNDCRLRLDAPRLSYVWKFRKTISRTEKLVTKLEFRIANPAFVSGRFRLQPEKERQAQTLRARQSLGQELRVDIDDAFTPKIICFPIDHRQIVWIAWILEILRCNQAPVRPERQQLPLGAILGHDDLGFEHLIAEQRELALAFELLVLIGLIYRLDKVRITKFDHKGKDDVLNILRISLFRRMVLACFVLCFDSLYIIELRQRKQVTKFGGINYYSRPKFNCRAGIEISHDHRLDAFALADLFGLHINRLVPAENLQLPGVHGRL